MPHVVLVGDSIFDNAAYTEGGPDVVSQVRGLLPPGWEATLLAVDGAITDGVAGQLGRLPEQATHLVLSVGGNNALKHMGILEVPVASVAKAVEVLADVASDFERRYRVAVAACLDTARPLAVCTIYNGCFDDQAFQRVASTTLTVFNDAIFEWPSSTPFPSSTFARCVPQGQTMPTRSNHRRWVGKRSPAS